MLTYTVWFAAAVSWLMFLLRALQYNAVPLLWAKQVRAYQGARWLVCALFFSGAIWVLR